MVRTFFELQFIELNNNRMFISLSNSPKKNSYNHNPIRNMWPSYNSGQKESAANYSSNI